MPEANDPDGSAAPAPSFHNPPGMMAPLGHYPHLAVVPAGARLLVLAGQTGHAADGSLPDSVDSHYRNALVNVLAILASQGAGPRHIVKLNTLAHRACQAGRCKGSAHRPARRGSADFDAWLSAPPCPACHEGRNRGLGRCAGLTGCH